MIQIDPLSVFPSPTQTRVKVRSGSARWSAPIPVGLDTGKGPGQVRVGSGTVRVKWGSESSPSQVWVSFNTFSNLNYISILIEIWTRYPLLMTSERCKTVKLIQVWFLLLPYPSQHEVRGEKALTFPDWFKSDFHYCVTLLRSLYFSLCGLIQIWINLIYPAPNQSIVCLTSFSGLNLRSRSCKFVVV